MKKLLLNVLSAISGIWLATIFVSGVNVELLPNSGFFGISLTAQWQIILLLGIILGFLNYFLKPILNVITLPLQIITLGLFSFIINIALIWIIDVIFKELSVPFIYPILLTTLIIWGINIVLSKIIKTK